MARRFLQRPVERVRGSCSPHAIKACALTDRVVCASSNDCSALPPVSSVTDPTQVGGQRWVRSYPASAGHRIDEHCDFAFGRIRTYLIGRCLRKVSVGFWCVHCPKGRSGLVSSSAHWLNSDSVDRFARRLSFKKESRARRHSRIRIGVAKHHQVDKGPQSVLRPPANTKTAKMIPRHQPSSVLLPGSLGEVQAQR